MCSPHQPVGRDITGWHGLPDKGCVTAACWHGLPDNRLRHCGLAEHMATVQIPGPVRKWVDQICRWDFKRVISAHFNSPVEARPCRLQVCKHFSHMLTVINCGNLSISCLHQYCQHCCFVPTQQASSYLLPIGFFIPCTLQPGLPHSL